MKKIKEGDVVILKTQSRALVNRKDLVTIEAPKECVVEAVRPFVRGPEDDHFGEGEVADVRPLLAGEYDPTAPIHTIALSGDFEPTLIHEVLPIIRRMKKTYVRTSDQ